VAEIQDRARDRGLARIAIHAAHEAGVDLQAFDVEFAQRVQVGRADAEIVEHQQHAERMQRLRDGTHALHVAHGGGFGELHGNAAGRQLVRLECCAHVVDDARTLQLRGGEIHRHDEIVAAGVAPAARIGAGLAHHPAPEFDDGAGGFGVGQEARGREQPVLRMLPAHQRFHAGDAAVLRAQLRLVVQAQFAVGDGAQQAVVDRAPRCGALPGHRGAEPARSHRGHERRKRRFVVGDDEVVILVLQPLQGRGGVRHIGADPQYTLRVRRHRPMLAHPSKPFARLPFGSETSTVKPLAVDPVTLSWKLPSGAL
jgi:hypothetical protein